MSVVAAVRAQHIIIALADAVEQTPLQERSVRKNAVGEIRSPLSYTPAAASIYSTQTYRQDNSFLIVGERLNASGSKKVRKLLNQDDWDGLLAIAKSQRRRAYAGRKRRLRWA